MNSKPLCVVTGCYNTLSGYGKKSYDFIRALIDLKKDQWEIKLISLRWGNTRVGILPDDDPLLQYEHRGEVDNRVPDVYIHIGLPTEFQRQARTLNILVTSGIEHDRPNPNWIHAANQADLVIVPSEFVKKSFQDTVHEVPNQDGTTTIIRCSVPVEVLFEGFDETIYKIVSSSKFSDRVKQEMAGIKENFAFLFVGHWLNGSIGEDRKNVSLLIRLFWDTFYRKTNKPALLLKTSSSKTSKMDLTLLMQRIEAIRRTYPQQHALAPIYIIHGDLTDDQMNELYNHPKVKAMVSFTHGEGFGRPLLEFSVTGKPIIASGWSGHVDFIPPKVNFLLPGTMTPVPLSAFPQEYLSPDCMWYSVDPQVAANTLMTVYEGYGDYMKTPMTTHRTRHAAKFTRRHMQTTLGALLETYGSQVGVVLNLPTFIPSFNDNELSLSASIPDPSTGRFDDVSDMRPIPAHAE